MSKTPVVVTFAAHYRSDLPDFKGADTARLSDDVVGEVRRRTPPAVKAATPDQWQVVQVLFDLGWPIVGGAIGTLLVGWVQGLIKRQKDMDPEPHVLIDQSIHVHLRVFVNAAEVTDPNFEAIEAAVIEAMGAGPMSTDLPPQLSDPSDRPAKSEGMTADEWWVEQQVAMGRVHHEDVQRLIRQSQSDDEDPR